ncbi:MAG: sulfatase-like hydrolase/transferase [Rhodospirillaceae bacterium]|jgi:arylsulfatase A-like enzyme|nr:sulfatase-like hydrolase/transferase [Rhodospirillaceae bacterium]MBT5241049.1 sulfatase-like hydrolase/transferase [Rhodospirillaceae bacterium]MBT6091000.1 sulfatase-like hydrolase/transferase [Rhodospirillaceae bacterium]
MYKNFIIAFMLVCTASPPGLMGFSIAHAADRSNVLLIMTDNQSPSLLGAYGNLDIKTPNIDQLAKEGVLFERAYATSGVCSPSRAVLLTGLIPSANGVHNGLPASYTVTDYAAIEEFRNLPQTLADAGYRTGLVGKYHLGAHEKPQLGFEWWTTFRGGHTSSFINAQVFDNGEMFNVLDSDEHLTDFWSRRAVDFIEAQKDDEGERPFFLWLSYNGPYILPPTVNQPPVSRHAAYYQDNVPAMPQNRVHPYMREWAKTNTAPAREETEGGTYPWSAIDALNNETAMINIAAEMTHVDEGIGTVLAALEAAGLDENTLVVFLADQGSSYGQLGMWGNSSWGDPEPAYNAHMQVPMIVRHPGEIEPGTTISAMVNQFDVFPSLLDYLGMDDLEIANSPGQSFAPMLRGEDMAWEDEIFFEYISTRVIQTRQWKYTKRFMASPNELYDMTNDPGETTNLIADPAYTEVSTGLDARLTQFWADNADPTFDVWNGGTGKALVYYGKRNNKFREAFPDWREPFVEKATAFRDR